MAEKSKRHNPNSLRQALFVMFSSIALTLLSFLMVLGERSGEGTLQPTPTPTPSTTPLPRFLTNSKIFPRGVYIVKPTLTPTPSPTPIP